MNKKLLFGSVLLAISLTMFACRLSSNGISGAQSGSSETTTPLLSQPTSQANVVQPNATPATVDQSVDQIDQDLNNLISTSQATDLTLPTMVFPRSIDKK